MLFRSYFFSAVFTKLDNDHINALFELTPSEFFDTETRNPELIRKSVEGMKKLSESDLIMLLSIINRLQK